MFSFFAAAAFQPESDSRRVLERSWFWKTGSPSITNALAHPTAQPNDPTSSLRAANRAASSDDQVQNNHYHHHNHSSDYHPPTNHHHSGNHYNYHHDDDHSKTPGDHQAHRSLAQSTTPFPDIGAGHG